MNHWKQELELTEAAAMRIEGLEGVAKRRFDEAVAQAELRGDGAQAVQTPEFADWMAARADTDAAWGRWAQVMDARPPAA